MKHTRISDGYMPSRMPKKQAKLAACHGKMAFANKGEALNNIKLRMVRANGHHRRMNNQRNIVGRGIIHPFHCRHCGHWHLCGSEQKPAIFKRSTYEDRREEQRLRQMVKQFRG